MTQKLPSDLISSPSSPEELQQAFAVFNQVSEQLTGAYAELQVKAEQLTQELAVANGELRRQFDEKEALSQRLAHLLAALPGGVVVLDAHGVIEEINPAAIKVLGGKLVGQSWGDVKQRSLVETTTPGEWTLKDQARRVSISSSQREGAGGEILLLHDVTDAHAMEEQLQRHKRLSAMGEMAAALAHQLRTPLAAALLYTSHLGDASLAADDREKFASKALGRLRHLEHLIKDMLVFVRGGRSAQEKISVSSLLTEVQHVMEPQMAQQNVSFEVSDLNDGTMLMGSREALAGALTNLLANALQACSAGGRVQLLVTREPPGNVAFRVKDTGRGIPMQVQERLFEPFFTTRTEGTGLGLAIVREVSQIHGGSISVQSAEGEGSEFCLKLPVLQEP